VILICYDGSPDSKAAIDHASELLAREPATVLTVWEPFVEVLAHTPFGFGLASTTVDYEKIDTLARRSAEEHAQEGAELARKAELDAQPRVRQQETTTAYAILAEAEAIEATAIVMGSRGLRGLKSLLLGSVSHAVLQHSDRTVIVVPSPDVAVARERERHDARA
jgi:nucleotide-binding universal stress UspA family protein